MNIVSLRVSTYSTTYLQQQQHKQQQTHNNTAAATAAQIMIMIVRLSPRCVAALLISWLIEFPTVRIVGRASDAVLVPLSGTGEAVVLSTQSARINTTMRRFAIIVVEIVREVEELLESNG